MHTTPERGAVITTSMAALVLLAVGTTVRVAAQDNLQVVSRSYYVWGSIDPVGSPDCPPPECVTGYNLADSEPVSGEANCECPNVGLFHSESSASGAVQGDTFSGSLHYWCEVAPFAQDSVIAGAGLSVGFTSVVESQASIRIQFSGNYTGIQATLRDNATGGLSDLLFSFSNWEVGSGETPDITVPLDPEHTYTLRMDCSPWEPPCGANVSCVVTVTPTDSNRAPRVYFVDCDSPSDPGTGERQDPYRRVQDAIASPHTIDGDTVVVLPGVYHENLSLAGKLLTVIGASAYEGRPLGQSILDASSPKDRNFGAAIQIAGSSDYQPSIVGFTLTGGTGVGDARWSDWKTGGGVCANGTAPRIQSCLIVDNGRELSRGGAFAESNGPITNCTIVENGHGASVISECSGPIANCVMWGNGEEPLDRSAVPQFSCIEGWTGDGSNIADDPLFVDPDNGDYRLTVGSPCIDAGSPEALSTVDLVGYRRPWGASVDMGAYEYTRGYSIQPGDGNFFSVIIHNPWPVRGGTVCLQVDPLLWADDPPPVIRPGSALSDAEIYTSTDVYDSAGERVAGACIVGWVHDWEQGSTLAAGDHEILRIAFAPAEGTSGGACGTVSFVDRLRSAIDAPEQWNVVTDDDGTAWPVSGEAVAICLAAEFLRADANADGFVDVSDAITTLLCLFLDRSCPACLDAADSNDDGTHNVADAIYSLEAIFGGAAPPPPPWPRCGQDPTPDELACPEFAGRCS